MESEKFELFVILFLMIFPLAEPGHQSESEHKSEIESESESETESESESESEHKSESESGISQTCWDILQKSEGTGKDNGIFTIKADHDDILGKTPFHTARNTMSVYCDMANRGWTVFMRKKIFNESTMMFGWTDYKKGFGSLNHDFWMGNEFLHQISTEKKLKMLITMRIRSHRNVTSIPHPYRAGDKVYLLFPTFWVKAEKEGFQLWVDSPILTGGGRGGETPLNGEMMGKISHRWNWNGMKFTTKDADQDLAEPGNCSHRKNRMGGWWYNDCTRLCATCTHMRWSPGYNLEDVQISFKEVLPGDTSTF